MSVQTSLGRMYGLILQELCITMRSLEIFMDILFFPMMNVILFGLITQFVGNVHAATNGQYLILGILLWEIVAINQYNVTVSSLWSVWSHNLTNIFMAPISIIEYLGAHVIAAFLRTVFVVTLLAIGTYFFFGFNLLSVGLVNALLFFINLSIFAWWIGIMLLGLIFRYGTRIQAIAWGTIFFFQPLTASFFPVTVLPGFLQAVAYALPGTYVFEAGRQALTHGGINWRYHGIAFALNVGYMALAALVFYGLFQRSKQTGQFARNDL
ncbi:MAG TPA: ABC transporter permease [Nevskiaceae bacterium]|nr:ABC transporter permease [Nevskiaceae bacterium]